jgi:hypothetical protein
MAKVYGTRPGRDNHYFRRFRRSAWSAGHDFHSAPSTGPAGIVTPGGYTPGVPKLTAFALLLLLTAALPACGAPPPSGPRPSPDRLPLIAVPLGFHAAVAAILPAGRIVEYTASDSRLLEEASVIAMPERQSPDRPGFIPLGAWLDERLVLALRLDLGPADDTPVLPFPSESAPVFIPITSALDRLGLTLSDDGLARAAITQESRERFVQDGGESGAEWIGLTAAANASVTDSPLNALLEKRVEAAILDPGALARFLLMPDHWLRDRVVFSEFLTARRPLALWVRTGDPAAFAVGRRLMHQAESLRSLGYARAE